MKSVIYGIVLVLVMMNYDIVATTDSPVLMKILQAVNVATSDKKLFDVTLQLLKSLCVCMKKTLEARENKMRFSEDINSVQVDEYYLTRKNDKDLDLYRNIYNNTCFTLRQEITSKLRKSFRDNDEVLNENEKNKNISTKINTMSQGIIKAELTDVIFKVLIESRKSHNYTIKWNNVFRKSRSLNANLSKKSIIFIITLYHEHKSRKHKIFDEDALDVILHTNYPIDIDVLTMINHNQTEEHRGKSCHLFSIYSYLFQKVMEHQINVFKILEKRKAIKIYIDVNDNSDDHNFVNVCCTNPNNFKLCGKDFIESQHIKSTTKVHNKEYEAAKVYQDTVSKIKTLVKLYDAKLKEERQRETNYKQNIADSDCFRDVPIRSKNIEAEANCTNNELLQTKNEDRITPTSQDSWIDKIKDTKPDTPHNSTSTIVSIQDITAGSNQNSSLLVINQRHNKFIDVRLLAFKGISIERKYSRDNSTTRKPINEASVSQNEEKYTPSINFHESTTYASFIPNPTNLYNGNELVNIVQESGNLSVKSLTDTSTSANNDYNITSATINIHNLTKIKKILNSPAYYDEEATANFTNDYTTINIQKEKINISKLPDIETITSFSSKNTTVNNNIIKTSAMPMEIKVSSNILPTSSKPIKSADIIIKSSLKEGNLKSPMNFTFILDRNILMNFANNNLKWPQKNTTKNNDIEKIAHSNFESTKNIDSKTTRNSIDMNPTQFERESPKNSNKKTFFKTINRDNFVKIRYNKEQAGFVSISNPTSLRTTAHEVKKPSMRYTTSKNLFSKTMVNTDVMNGFNQYNRGKETIRTNMPTVKATTHDLKISSSFDKLTNVIMISTNKQASTVLSKLWTEDILTTEMASNGKLTTSAEILVFNEVTTNKEMTSCEGTTTSKVKLINVNKINGHEVSMNAETTTDKETASGTETVTNTEATMTDILNKFTNMQTMVSENNTNSQASSQLKVTENLNDAVSVSLSDIGETTISVNILNNESVTNSTNPSKKEAVTGSDMSNNRLTAALTDTVTNQKPKMDIKMFHHAKIPVISGIGILNTKETMKEINKINKKVNNATKIMYMKVPKSFSEILDKETTAVAKIIKVNEDISTRSSLLIAGKITDNHEIMTSIEKLSGSDVLIRKKSTTDITDILKVVEITTTGSEILSTAKINVIDLLNNKRATTGTPKSFSTKTATDKAISSVMELNRSKILVRYKTNTGSEIKTNTLTPLGTDSITNTSSTMKSHAMTYEETTTGIGTKIMTNNDLKSGSDILTNDELKTSTQLLTDIATSDQLKILSSKNIVKNRDLFTKVTKAVKGSSESMTKDKIKVGTEILTNTEVKANREIFTDVAITNGTKRFTNVENKTNTDMVLKKGQSVPFTNVFNHLGTSNTAGTITNKRTQNVTLKSTNEDVITDTVMVSNTESTTTPTMVITVARLIGTDMSSHKSMIANGVMEDNKANMTSLVLGNLEVVTGRSTKIERLIESVNLTRLQTTTGTDVLTNKAMTDTNKLIYMPKFIGSDKLSKNKATTHTFMSPRLEAVNSDDILTDAYWDMSNNKEALNYTDILNYRNETTDTDMFISVTPSVTDIFSHGKAEPIKGIKESVEKLTGNMGKKTNISSKRLIEEESTMSSSVIVANITALEIPIEESITVISSNKKERNYTEENHNMYNITKVSINVVNTTTDEKITTDESTTVASFIEKPFITVTSSIKEETTSMASSSDSEEQQIIKARLTTKEGITVANPITERRITVDTPLIEKTNEIFGFISENSVGNITTEESTLAYPKLDLSTNFKSTTEDSFNGARPITKEINSVIRPTIEKYTIMSYPLQGTKATASRTTNITLHPAKESTTMLNRSTEKNLINPAIENIAVVSAVTDDIVTVGSIAAVRKTAITTSLAGVVEVSGTTPKTTSEIISTTTSLKTEENSILASPNSEKTKSIIILPCPLTEKSSIVSSPILEDNTNLVNSNKEEIAIVISSVADKSITIASPNTEVSAFTSKTTSKDNTTVASSLTEDKTLAGVIKKVRSTVTSSFKEDQAMANLITSNSVRESTTEARLSAEVDKIWRQTATKENITVTSTIVHKSATAVNSAVDKSYSSIPHPVSELRTMYKTTESSTVISPVKKETTAMASSSYVNQIMNAHTITKERNAVTNTIKEEIIILATPVIKESTITAGSIVEESTGVFNTTEKSSPPAPTTSVVSTTIFKFTSKDSSTVASPITKKSAILTKPTKGKNTIMSNYVTEANISLSKTTQHSITVPNSAQENDIVVNCTTEEITSLVNPAVENIIVLKPGDITTVATSTIKTSNIVANVAAVRKTSKTSPATAEVSPTTSKSTSKINSAITSPKVEEGTIVASCISETTTKKTNSDAEKNWSVPSTLLEESHTLANFIVEESGIVTSSAATESTSIDRPITELSAFTSKTTTGISYTGSIYNADESTTMASFTTEDSATMVSPITEKSMTLDTSESPKTPKYPFIARFTTEKHFNTFELVNEKNFTGQERLNVASSIEEGKSNMDSLTTEISSTGASPITEKYQSVSNSITEESTVMISFATEENSTVAGLVKVKSTGMAYPIMKKVVTVDNSNKEESTNPASYASKLVITVANPILEEITAVVSTTSEEITNRASPTIEESTTMASPTKEEISIVTSYTEKNIKVANSVTKQSIVVASAPTEEAHSLVYSTSVESSTVTSHIKKASTIEAGPFKVVSTTEANHIIDKRTTVFIPNTKTDTQKHKHKIGTKNSTFVIKPTIQGSTTNAIPTSKQRLSAIFANYTLANINTLTSMGIEKRQGMSVPRIFKEAFYKPTTTPTEIIEKTENSLSTLKNKLRDLSSYIAESSNSNFEMPTVENLSIHQLRPIKKTELVTISRVEINNTSSNYSDSVICNQKPPKDTSSCTIKSIEEATKQSRTLDPDRNLKYLDIPHKKFVDSTDLTNITITTSGVDTLANIPDSLSFTGTEKENIGSANNIIISTLDTTDNNITQLSISETSDSTSAARWIKDVTYNKSPNFIPETFGTNTEQYKSSSKSSSTLLLETSTVKCIAGACNIINDITSIQVNTNNTNNIKINIIEHLGINSRTVLPKMTTEINIAEYKKERQNQYMMTSTIKTKKKVNHSLSSDDIDAISFHNTAQNAISSSKFIKPTKKCLPLKNMRNNLGNSKIALIDKSEARTVKSIKYNTYQPAIKENDSSMKTENNTRNKYPRKKLDKIASKRLKITKRKKHLDHKLSRELTNYVKKPHSTKSPKIVRQKITRHAFPMTTQHNLRREYNMNLISRIVTKNFRKMKSSETTILDPLAKTNMYLLRMMPPITQRKVMKRIQMAKRKQVLPKSLFSHFTMSNTPHRSYVKPTRIHASVTSLPRQIILRPKFETIDKIKNFAPVEYFRPKPILIQNDKDFYKEEEFKAHHHPKGLTWKEKINFVQEALHNQLIAPEKRSENDIPGRSPHLAPLEKPSFLRDRIYSIRNYVADYVKPKKETDIWKEFFQDDQVEDEEDRFNFNPSLFYYKKNYPDSTTVRTTRTKRKGRTLFFYSPTVPYNRYF